MKNNTLTIFILITSLLVCFNTNAQQLPPKTFDTIYIWKGSWGLFEDDELFYMTVEHREGIYFQENTRNHIRMSVMFLVKYYTDSTFIMSFDSSEITTKILNIEDPDNNLIYIHSDINGKEYFSPPLNHSCLSKLNDYLGLLTKQIHLYSYNLSSPGNSKEGTYAFAIYVALDNIDCF